MVSFIRVSAVLVAICTSLLIGVRPYSAHVESSKQASSVTLEPVITNSFYINPYMYSYGGSPSSTLYGLGEGDANYENTILHVDNIHCQAGQYIIYAVIDFGSPRATYIYNWDGLPINYGSGAGQVAQVAKSYADGWYQYSFNCFSLRLIIGVNNSYICGNQLEAEPCDTNAGYALGGAVDEANQLLASANEAWQIKAYGGIDAETDPGFGSYASTYSFASSYNAYLSGHGEGWNLYDYGDASPSSFLDWGSNTYQKVYTLAWGLGYDEPMPEAYSTGQNQNWNNVAVQNAHGGQGAIQYAPVMVDGACTINYDNSMWQDFVNRNSAYMPVGSSAASYQQPLSFDSLPSKPENWCALPPFLDP